MRGSRIPLPTGVSRKRPPSLLQQPLQSAGAVAKRSRPHSSGSGSSNSVSSLPPAQRRTLVHVTKSARTSPPPALPPGVASCSSATTPAPVPAPAMPLGDASTFGASSVQSAAASASPADTEGFTTVSSRRGRGRAANPAVVGVAPPPPAPSVFPAFRVPAQEGFETSYDAVAALEEDCSALSIRCLAGRDSSTVLKPLNAESYHHLEMLAAASPTARVKLVKLEPSVFTTRGVVMGYPLRLPTDLLLRHPQVESATRCSTTRTQEATRQVTVTLRGPLLPQLSLGGWGTFYLRPWVPEPLRCYRCQRYGHHQAACNNATKCGICSGSHSTEECLRKFKDKQPVTHCCPNCSQPHHAWFKSCPARLRLVERGRERQTAWVATQQLSSATPAPPGTFVWGAQRRGTSPAPFTPSADMFPLLAHDTALPPRLHTALTRPAAPCAPTVPAQPRAPARRPHRATRATQTTAPCTDAPPPPPPPPRAACTAQAPTASTVSPPPRPPRHSRATQTAATMRSLAAVSVEEDVEFFHLPEAAFRAFGTSLAETIATTLAEALNVQLPHSVAKDAIHLVIDEFLNRLRTGPVPDI